MQLSWFTINTLYNPFLCSFVFGWGKVRRRTNPDFNITRGLCTPLHHMEESTAGNTCWEISQSTFCLYSQPHQEPTWPWADCSHISCFWFCDTDADQTDADLLSFSEAEDFSWQPRTERRPTHQRPDQERSPAVIAGAAHPHTCTHQTHAGLSHRLSACWWFIFPCQSRINRSKESWRVWSKAGWKPDNSQITGWAKEIHLTVTTTKMWMKVLYGET